MARGSMPASSVPPSRAPSPRPRIPTRARRLRSTWRWLSRRPATPLRCALASRRRTTCSRPSTSSCSVARASGAATDPGRQRRVRASRSTSTRSRHCFSEIGAAVAVPEELAEHGVLGALQEHLLVDLELLRARDTSPDEVLCADGLERRGDEQRHVERVGDGALSGNRPARRRRASPRRRDRRGTPSGGRGPPRRLHRGTLADLATTSCSVLCHPNGGSKRPCR